MNDENLVARVREHRDLPPKKIAKLLGVSVRAVDRALAALGDEDARRRTKRRRAAGVALGVVTLLLATRGVLHWRTAREDARRAEEARASAAVARTNEKALYAALDKRESGREDEAAKHLKSEDEALRLSAVRYLLTCGSRKHLEEVLEHLADETERSERVRLATIQLSARTVDPMLSPSLEARFVEIASRKEASLAERTLALGVLKGRAAFDLRPLASLLLELLGDAQVTIRQGAHAALEAAFPEAHVAWNANGPALSSVWKTRLDKLAAPFAGPVALAWTSPVASVTGVAPDLFTALRCELERIRGDQSAAASRERSRLLHEIGRLRTPASRGFLLDLASQERADDVERLAAVSALYRAGDTAAIGTLVDHATNPLVRAKVQALRNAKP